MRIGVDTSKIPGAAVNGALWTLGRVKRMGLEGALFRSAFDLSPTLDPAELADLAAAAADLGLYLEVGAGVVNPYAVAEAPQIREIGDGDYLAGMRRVIEVLGDVGVHELWAVTGSYKFRIHGIHACDRFRTDVDWAEQLTATSRLLARLAPLLRDAGSHLNVETHEEITSFEAVRLVEDAGADAVGITFDTANVVVRGEHPVRAAQRVAPYARQSQVRDVSLLPTEDGWGRFLAPVGEGIIDWPALLGALSGGPLETLTIEGVGRTSAEMSLYVGSPIWRDAHPDLSDAELEGLLRLGQEQAARVRRGEAADLDALRSPYAEDVGETFIRDSAAALRRLRDDSSIVHSHVHPERTTRELNPS